MFLSFLAFSFSFSGSIQNFMLLTVCCCCCSTRFFWLTLLHCFACSGHLCFLPALVFIYLHTLCPLCSLTKLNVSPLKALQPKENHPIQWSCFQASDPYSGNILMTVSKMDLSLLCGFWYILCNAHALRTFLILLGICKEMVQVFCVIKDAKISALLEKATYLEGFSKLMFFKILRNFQPKVSHFILKWITVN